MTPLVTHYFRTILRRDPDDGERQAWEAEAQRTFDSADTSEAWLALTRAFFAGAPYRELGRSNADFLHDLYETFLGRHPDHRGFEYWLEQMEGGMARDAVLAYFLSSPECHLEPVPGKPQAMVRERRPPVSLDKAAPGSYEAAVMPELAPTPLQVVGDGSVARRLHIMLPALRIDTFSGGPNTALALGQVLADRGIPVNFVSVDLGKESDESLLHRHLAVLTGIAKPRAAVTFTAGNDPARPIIIGHEDILLGTAWWTVHKFRHCLAKLRTPRFVYLIQEFEPGLYPFSSKYALAAETYKLDHLPIYNHRFLHDFFADNAIGAGARRGLLAALRPRGTGTWFDPVVDPKYFHYDEGRRDRPIRSLLFYARPSIGVRNLYEIGCAALGTLAEEGAFGEGWELCSMGERIREIELPRGNVVEPLPWMGFDGYAARMRSCDVLLSLMLSPHPSYPPLEGAASGAMVVTNEYANKTAAAFATVSSNIIAVPPSVEGVADGIRQAIARLDDHEARRRASRLATPRDWASALAGAAERIAAFWREA